MNTVVFRVVRLQIGLTTLAALCAALLTEDPSRGALSALAGGGIAIAGSLVYAWFAHGRRAHPGVILRRHFRAEAMKMFATLILLVVVISGFSSVSALALLGGFALAQSAYWLGLLSK